MSKSELAGKCFRMSTINTTIRVDADSASFSMTIENVPSENPRTGRIAALSLIACLRKACAPLRVGT